MKDRSSPNHDARPADEPIDILLLHYTGMRSAEEALRRLTDPAPPTGVPVSSHYVVEEDGAIWRLVPEERRAWHAGLSHWRGHERINGRCLGIEIVNPGHEWGYRAFPPAQVEAVLRLGLDLIGRHPIPSRNVVGHSDVAPHRKSDPGELFPWRELAARGLGLWPQEAAPVPEDMEGLRSGLAAIGYGLPLTGDLDDGLRGVLRAFQRHWRPECVNGEPDAGTRARLGGLLGLPAMRA